MGNPFKAWDVGLRTLTYESGVFFPRVEEHLPPEFPERLLPARDHPLILMLWINKGPPLFHGNPLRVSLESSHLLFNHATLADHALFSSYKDDDLLTFPVTSFLVLANKYPPTLSSIFSPLDPDRYLHPPLFWSTCPSVHQSEFPSPTNESRACHVTPGVSVSLDCSSRKNGSAPPRSESLKATVMIAGPFHSDLPPSAHVGPAAHPFFSLKADGKPTRHQR